MTAGLHTPRVLRFGIFEADLNSGELRKSGLKLKLTGQPFQVLEILLERPGQVVTRDELQKRLWPDTFVDIDHNLNAAINRIREALGDSAENPRFVETLPRRGYRFIAPINGVGEKNASQQSLSSEPHSALAETSQQAALTASSQTNALAVPRIRKPWRIAAIAAGSILCVALAFGIWLVIPPHQPHVLKSTQLTNDGKFKCCLVTDGSRVYFTELTADGVQIKYISTSGGESVLVSVPLLDRHPHLQISDISPDHDRLLVNVYRTFVDCSLWIVPVTGSSPRELTNLRDVSCGRGGAWSPDGQLLAYSNKTDIFTARIDGTEPRKLATAKGNALLPVWSPDGKLVRFLVSDAQSGATTTWFEVPTAGGEPREVTPQWKYKDFEGFGRWTVDGKYFLFLAGQDGRNDIWAIREQWSFPWLRKRVPMQLTAGPVRYGSVAVSPDRKKIFTRGVEVRGELERYDSKSRQFKPFLQGLSADCCVYSNDGNWIAYVTYPERSLWRSRADGSQRQQLTWSPMMAVNPHWSPDGTEIAFSGQISAKPWKTFIIPAEGGQPHQLTQNDCSELDAQWSPDGARMIFAPFADDAANTASCPVVIYNMDLRTHEISTIPGSEGLWSPRWSPDGNRIVALTSGGKALMIYEASSEKWSKLTDPPPGTQGLGWPHWSRDGKSVYFGANSQAIYSIRIATRKFEKLADLSKIENTGSNGSWLAFDPDDNPLILREASLNEIYALDVEAQ